MDSEKFLQLHQIKYTIHHHRAVYTCEEAEKYCHNIPGISSKNLFLRNENKQRYFLAVLPANKRIDLKKFAQLVKSKKISFANTQSLKEKLNTTSGSVSPFNLLHDQEHQIELFIDQQVYDAKIVGFHPNYNTATIELSQKMFHKFLQTLKNPTTIANL